MKRIRCQECDGNYILRDGKFGVFAGCSNYPRCRSTKKLYEVVLEYIRIYGIGIYRWDRECWKCKKKTAVYSYYLDYELAELDEFFNSGLPAVGLGDLAYIDGLLSQKYATIQKRYSNTTHSSYMANTCSHCGALQGRNYVVEDPHEIVEELWHSRGMDKFWIETIACPDTSPLVSDIKRIYSQTP